MKLQFKSSLMYFSATALALVAIVLPTFKHRVTANSQTTTRIWLDHGSAGNWHASKNYIVAYYPDG